LLVPYQGPNTYKAWRRLDLSTSAFGSLIRLPTACTARSSKQQNRSQYRRLHRQARRRPPLLMTDLSRGGPALRHRAIAELVGTAFLVTAVVGSGIAAQRLSPDDVGLQLLENALATGAALAALIIALQPVSAAFNPVVTVLERLTGGLRSLHAVMLVGAQVVGGLIGVVVANLMFSDPAVSLSTTDRGGSGRWLGEVVATAGLVLLITTLSRTGRPQLIGWAVGAYITAGYWFTSSTSFANPAVTIARMFSDTFAGIEPASVPMFLIAQIVGGTVGYGLARTIYQRPTLTALTNENRHELDATRRFETSADDFQARITAPLRDPNV
jgi:glycerol uptake facilitator-like aquaporin